ncbi:MAG: ribosome maturation factor RimM [Veillonellales bacterium]
MAEQLIAVGKIVAPHGVRGDVRVIPLTDFPQRFQKSKNILLEDRTCLTIEQVKYHNRFVLLKFRTFNTINEVESLKGKILYVEEKDVVPLPVGQYYHFQIVGLQVYTDQGKYIGTITDILETGSNDVYVVEQEGSKPVLIPALKKVVQKVDVANGQMMVKLQEEWE